MIVGLTTVIGLDEKVSVFDVEGNNFNVIARIDTGADGSSIDKSLYKSLELGPIISKKTIKSASGQNTRDQIKLKFEIKGKVFEGKFNIADRKHLKYKMLIGQNILRKGFLIDPSIKRLIK
jgi:hypothetical protein